MLKNDKHQVQNLIKNKKLDAIMASGTDFVDDIILSMMHDGIIDCLDDGFRDKRRHNSYVPFKHIMTLAIAAKMKVHTSLTDIPYAIQDHRVLAELGFNANRDTLFTEGTIRHLLGKYTAEHLVEYYNNVVQKQVFEAKDIKPDIHILDCTKIAVNMDNENYENATFAIDRRGNKMRGYKLASLRGLYKDTGVIEEIRFGTAATHDLMLSEEMLKSTKCFNDGDILINDKGFLSRPLINFLKSKRNVDTYVPLRRDMVAYKEEDIGMFWTSKNPHEDVPLNTCVVWDKEDNRYFVFITTDMAANAADIVNIYELRTEIEEDFRQLKDFWKMEDFKSTKYHMIVFHIVCVLLGYLFYQLYVNNNGQYVGKSLPVILKNYKTRFLNYLILYSGEYFCCMSMREFIEFRDECDEEIREFLLGFME